MTSTEFVIERARLKRVRKDAKRLREWNAGGWDATRQVLWRLGLP